MLKKNITEYINNNDNSNISKLIDDYISSPLLDLLHNIQTLDYICITLIYILFIQFMFKFYIKQDTKIKLSNILGTKINNNLNYYFNTVVILNKKVSNIYIFVIFLLLILILFFNLYITNELISDLGNYVEIHTRSK